MMSFEKTTVSQTILCSMWWFYTHEWDVMNFAMFYKWHALNTSYHLWFSDSEQFPLFRQNSAVCVHAAVARTPTQKEASESTGFCSQSPHPPLQLPCTTCKWALVSLALESTRLAPSQDKGGQAGGWWAWPGLRRQPIHAVSRWPPSGLLACLPLADPAVCWRGCRRLPGSGWTGSGWPQLLRCGCSLRWPEL